MLFKRIILAATLIGLVTLALPAEETVSLRAAAEDNFISGLRMENSGDKSHEINLPVDSLEVLDNGLLRHKGAHYNLRSVNASTYYTLDADSTIVPVFSAEYPAESVANLLILPLPQSYATPMQISVLLHEPGEKETFETTVGDFVSYCREHGALPYWGVEELSDKALQGALFMYNSDQGYDHVVKINCNPEAVIAGEGPVIARVSLYVPTKNVKNLFDDDNKVDNPNLPKYQVGKKK